MEKAFIVAAKEFFGFKPGQTLLEFKEEVGQLTAKDKAEMAEGLGQALGCTVKLPLAV